MSLIILIYLSKFEASVWYFLKKIAMKIWNASFQSKNDSACFDLKVCKRFCTETWPGVTVTAQVSFSIFLGKSEPRSIKSSHNMLSRNFWDTWASIDIPVTGWWTEVFTLLTLTEGSEPIMLLISELIFSVTLTLAVEVDCCWILVDVTLSRLV